MPKISVCAPGKILLSGEHAVVYGNPALSLAVDLYTTVSIFDSKETHISLQLFDFDQSFELTYNEILMRYDLLQARFEQFQHGHKIITEVLKRPEELCIFILGAFFRYFDLDIKQGCTIQISSDLPMGSGMGSSAALIVAFIYALKGYFQVMAEESQLIALAKKAEAMQHGKCGIDIDMAILGGGQIYQDSTLTPFKHCPSSLTLVHTGKPSCSTGVSVMQVAEYFTKAELIDQFKAVMLQMKSAFELKDEAKLKIAVQENHHNLLKIGVVPEIVAQFITEIVHLGGAAKICGAGAVQGDTAGMIWVVGDINLTHLVNKYGYTSFQVKQVRHGVQNV